MSNTLSSPKKPKTGSSKITYTGKAKRKRNVSDAAQESSGEESDSRQSMDPREEASPSKSTATPQELEVSLPGPSCNSPESQVLPAKPVSKARGSPSRASSVISPDDSTLHKSPSARSVRAKSSDNTSPASKTDRPDSPDNDADETSSIAESSVGNRIRRSEPQRIQYFEDQSECDDIIPHRAHCSRCDKWIHLGNRQTYVVRPWENHRRKCDQRPPVSEESRRNKTERSRKRDQRPPVSKESCRDKTEVGKLDGDIPLLEASMDVTKQPSLQLAEGEAGVEQHPEGEVLVSGSSLYINKQSSPNNDAERKAFLEADPRAQEIRLHEILCRSCQKWIKLSAGRLGNWHSHQQRCSGVVLSRVATAERKISLLNDPQVKSFSPRNVECAFCRTNVESDGVAQYDLTKWFEHKTKCSSPAIHPTPKAPASRHSRVFPSPSEQTFIHTPTNRVYRPATSLNSASTDAINDVSLARVGEKRPREDDEDETLEDRRVNRPRTEAYQAPEYEAPGPWGWFMQPLKAFVRGFREGLGTPST